MHAAIEQELAKLAEYHEQLLAEYDARFDLLPPASQLRDLKGENDRLRAEFEKLNNFITQLVEARRHGKADAKRKVEVERKKKESLNFSRPVASLEETKNVEKQLAAVQGEFLQLSARIKQVSDPQYVADLEERIVSMEQRMKKIGRNKRSLALDQLHRGKELRRIAESGEVELFADINSEKVSLAGTSAKIRELDAKLERNVGTIQEKSGKFAELRATWKKLSDEADSLGISLENDAVTADTQKRLGKLLAKKEALQKVVSSLRIQGAVSSHEGLNKAAGLHAQIGRLSAQLQGKDEYIASL